MRVVVITGPSGAGKTVALHSFEDAGYFTNDNLPPRMLAGMLAFLRAESIDRGAVVSDTRSGPAFQEFGAVLEALRSAQFNVETLYLDSSNESLVQRFKETRRPHPVFREPQNGRLKGGIVEAIMAERAQLEQARDIADTVLDTSSMTPVELRNAIHEMFGGTASSGLLVSITSFGFKHGLPIDADLVFDVRFLANPHYVPELAALDGTDARVIQFVRNDPRSCEFEARISDLVEFALPQYVQEGKAYLNVAIGCTGGQHRSVVLAEGLAGRLRQAGYRTGVRHRDIELGPRGHADVPSPSMKAGRNPEPTADPAGAESE